MCWSGLFVVVQVADAGLVLYPQRGRVGWEGKTGKLFPVSFLVFSFFGAGAHT